MRLPNPGNRPLLTTIITLAVIRFSVLYLDQPVALLMLRTPPWLRDLAEWATRFGRSDLYLVPLAVVIVLLAFGAHALAGEHRRAAARFWAATMGFIWLSMALSGLVNDVVKLIAGRPRPNIPASTTAPFTFGYDFQSFASGHTAIAFGLAFSLGLLWPRWRGPLLLFALAVGASRIILRSHYLADVIGGALIAWLTVAWLARFLAERKLVFRRSADGRIEPRFPG